MKKGCSELMDLGEDNAAGIKRVLGCHKNILICGMQGAGKITNSIAAVGNSERIFFLPSPVETNIRSTPGYQRYLKYIGSLNPAITIVADLTELLGIKDEIVLIIHEIHDRPEGQLRQIDELYSMENVTVLQIVRCIKTIGPLIKKIGIVVEMSLTGAFTLDREFCEGICSILKKRGH